MNFGVSPAWFLSLFGETFTVNQMVESLGMLKHLGFVSWQPEVFLEDALEEWTAGRAEELRKTSEGLGLCPRTFVAHFLGVYFADERVLVRNRDLDLLDRVLEALESWTETEVISVLLPPFGFDAPVEAGRSRKWNDALVNKMREYARRIESSGRVMALEAMPGNVAGGSAGLSALLGCDGLDKVGINYDSGHFHAAGESQDMVLARLGGRVACTHLCDNDGVNNLSLAPGDGTILWDRVSDGLHAAGYKGPWDLEIRCPADAVESAYRRGRELLERHQLKESA